MPLFAAMAMVGSAALCFGGSLFSRRPLAVFSASMMLMAMVDLVAFGIIAPVAWAGLLILSGLLLGFDLRRREPYENLPGGMASPFSLHRKVMLAATLGYLAAGWLTTTHIPVDGSNPAVTNIGHTHGFGEMAVLPMLGVGVLTAILAFLMVVSIRRRRSLLAVEAGGMAAMLFAMLLPSAS